MKKCEVCQSEFKARNHEHKYCSKECNREAKRQKYKQNHVEKQYENKECLKCGSEFEPNRYNQKYCSTKCYERAKEERYLERYPEKRKSKREKNSKQCKYCKQDFFSKKYYNQRFCSIQCWGFSRKKYLSIPECLESASRKLDKNIGYVRVYCPMHPKANTWGYVYEHRVIMEGIIGRHLETDEHVHHKNGKRWDNRPENLEVLSASEHCKLTQAELKL